MAGAYIVTCGTLHKQAHLTTPERLTEFRDLLFRYAAKHGWRLQAWAILANHYHFVGLSPETADDAASLRLFLGQLHEISTKRLNRRDNVAKRRVWYNYWDTHISHRTSYYARLKYVHDNPVHHGIVLNAANYEWCSRAWLEREARRAQVKMIDGFKTDQLNIPDEF